jgi:glycosyltransferase involved in cell wall biosynthesis
VTLLHVLGGDVMGGCERLSLDLAAEFAEDGLEQHVLFYSRSALDRIRRAFEALRVGTVWIPYEGRVLPFVSAVAMACRGRKVRTVLTHGFGFHPLIATGARLGGACKVFALVGNPPPPEPGTLRRVRARAHLARPLVSGEIACTGYVRDRMVREYRLPRARITVVPNWVRVEAIARRARLARAARNAGVPSDSRNPAPVLLMVARLDPIKDQGTVIRALAALRETQPSARLRLAGDGPTRPELERLAGELNVAEHVEFLGECQDIPEQLGSADVFVYSTTPDEGFGIVLAEAMAAGVPIVCTDVGPCREVLRDGEAGMLVPPGDPDAVAAAIRSLLSRPERYHQLAGDAYAVALEHYDVAIAGRQLRTLLEL